MIDFDISILQCPVTRENLSVLSRENALQIIKDFNVPVLHSDHITEGLINSSQTYFYPVLNDILLLLPVYALYIGKNTDIRNKMAFDKERVFKYYNQISFDTKNNLSLYEDSPKWVDFRNVSGDYIRNSFKKVKKFINPTGTYLLDIASGPIGLKEYIDISENYDIRICCDISLNALIQAKNNYSHRKGIYICADIINIPLKENICDAVICQHTLYHIPRKEQETAVFEMYRVARPGSRIAIVYSLFWHSLFMNITLFPIQVYRIARHFAGKTYVHLFGSKPRLYFYPHSLRWFRNTFGFSEKMEIFCWRSTNKYFLNLYVHEWLGGKKFLNWLTKSEDKYPKFWGKFGEYPLIVIKK